jgi:hypothetical protein
MIAKLKQQTIQTICANINQVECTNLLYILHFREPYTGFYKQATKTN